MAAAATTITETADTTVTSTVTSTARARTSLETVYVSVTETFTPPTQTVCDGAGVATTTFYAKQTEQTKYEVDYVTYNTWVTVWVGQTQYVTSTDRAASTACWAAGGRYGVY
ncbi:hypothetical protein V8F33_002401 [Rhypophila sp. PSN 637]